MRADAAGVDSDLLFRYYLPQDAPALPVRVASGRGVTEKNGEGSSGYRKHWGICSAASCALATSTPALAHSHLLLLLLSCPFDPQETVRIGKATGTLHMEGSHLSPKVRKGGSGSGLSPA